MTTKPRTFLSFLTGKTLWIATATLILAAAGGYAYYSKVSAASRTTTAAQVQTAVVQRGNLILSASGKGTLIANSDATFGFQTSGQVKDVSVKVGDQVKAGQVLAQLDDTLLQMKYGEAQQALQELSSAASIATVQHEIATAQDTEYYAHEWLKYLLSPEVITAEENLAIAEQRLAEAQTAAKAAPSAAADQTVKEK
ncbi:MAG TPA: biotin/lipoyl-binding protein, partial [Anaerolineales bacterium]|nr:biotin/lipoyl-binding protein [Anaerolineales bacterium]